jgi:hypothetical protein
LEQPDAEFVADRRFVMPMVLTDKRLRLLQRDRSYVHAAKIATQKSVAQPLSLALEFVQQCQPKESTVKLELTESEVKDIVLRHINRTFTGVWAKVEIDCAYGYFKKAVIETEQEANDPLEEEYDDRA